MPSSVEAKSGSERRIAERSRVTFGMVCDAGASMSSGRVLDLSMTGAFIHTDQPLPIGTLVTLFPVGDAGDDLFPLLRFLSLLSLLFSFSLLFTSTCVVVFPYA